MRTFAVIVIGMWIGFLSTSVCALLIRFRQLSNRVDDIEQSQRPVQCAHTDVRNIGTFGHPEYECTLCHQVVS